MHTVLNHSVEMGHLTQTLSKHKINTFLLKTTYHNFRQFFVYLFHKVQEMVNLKKIGGFKYYFIAFIESQEAQMLVSITECQKAASHLLRDRWPKLFMQFNDDA